MAHLIMKIPHCINVHEQLQDIERQVNDGVMVLVRVKYPKNIANKSQNTIRDNTVVIRTQGRNEYSCMVEIAISFHGLVPRFTRSIL